MCHSCRNRTKSVNRGDIIIPSHDFPDEIHNEDSHYTRLVIGFLYTKDDNRIPIPLHDPELEALLYPDLFPDNQELTRHVTQPDTSYIFEYYKGQ